jgi:hypothetical protein
MFPSSGEQKSAIYDNIPDMESQSQFSNYQDNERHDGKDSTDEKFTSQDHESVSFLGGENASQPQHTSLHKLVCNPHTWIIGVGVLAIFCLMFLVVLLSVCAMIQRTEARRMSQDGDIIRVDFVSWVSSAPSRRFHDNTESSYAVGRTSTGLFGLTSRGSAMDLSWRYIYHAFRESAIS